MRISFLVQSTFRRSVGVIDMKACWADNTLLPGSCVWEEGEIAKYDCELAKAGTTRDNCPHWIPKLAVDLCLEILGEGGFCAHCKTPERCE